LGYKVKLCMPKNASEERKKILKAYGVEVVLTDPGEGSDGAIRKVRELYAEDPERYFYPDQYTNPANPRAHYESTGPEIWDQTSGRITHLVASVGTGGTISGLGRYLKSKNPDIEIVGADPEGSVYSGGTGRPYLVEGIGEDFWPDTYDRSVVDRVVMVSDRDSFLMARRITKEEGILVGGSCGTAVAAALTVASDLGPGDVVVVVFPDSGRGYLSKLYNDGWMADYGFLRTAGQTAGDVLERKHSELPRLVHVHPEETVREVIAILREYEVSQVPVVSAEPPLAFAEVVGSVHERQLLQAAFDDPGLLDKEVAAVMGPLLPTVGSGEPVQLAVKRLEGAGAVLVVDAGHPVGILTRSDLLDFLASR
ncbi:MAG: pyridoxal-phosphate dependent enzyme, partial [Actinobacteria bacterium]|nr:pyridoxal-phosphate dependent enzyme [Actinomycetota bacterium]